MFIRTRYLAMLGCAVAVMGCAALSKAAISHSEPSTFVLAREGKAACTIVTAENPTPAARLAALELQYHVLKATGAELPVQTDIEQVGGPRILVGDSAATRAMGFNPSDFGPQEYSIAFRPDTLILIGRDWQDTEANRAEFGRPMCCGDTLEDTRHKIDYWKTVGYPERSVGEMRLPGVYDKQGTCYAAYDFLERFCGIRWYGAPEIAVIIPSQKTFTVSGADIRRAPALKYRDALWSGNWPFMKGQWGPVTQSEIQLFWRRLRLGGEKWAGNHTFHPRTIETTFTDPEYQAQGPGHGTQLCYTNPKLVTEVARMARDFFDGKENPPAGWKAVGDYFAIVPDDNSKFCQCAQCQALLDSGKDMRTGQFSSGEVSNYFFSFVNAVAREVAKTHPGKYIATLAYWNYAFPPRGFDLEPNVSIAPCLHTCYYAIHKEMRTNDMKLYREWLEIAEAPIFLWNYYHHPMEAALINKFKCFPNVMVHETARAMRMFINDGIRGIFICGEQDMLEGYVIAKIWDDPTQDVDAIIDEFFELYFGAAANPMKKFYLQLEEIACDPKNYPRPLYRKNGIDWEDVAWTHLGTEKRMKRLGALIEEAQARAQTKEEKQRVALWTDALWKWMEDGRAEYLAKQTETNESGAP
ncbi:MAG: DUF4838 domain-containing protein [Candidatus Hydrogenedentota bacterium]